MKQKKEDAFQSYSVQASHNIYNKNLGNFYDCIKHKCSLNNKWHSKYSSREKEKTILNSLAIHN